MNEINGVPEDYFGIAVEVDETPFYQPEQAVLPQLEAGGSELLARYLQDRNAGRVFGIYALLERLHLTNEVQLTRADLVELHEHGEIEYFNKHLRQNHPEVGKMLDDIFSFWEER